MSDSLSRTRFRLLLPLGGEGWDEGVARHQELRRLQARAACPLTPTLSPVGAEGAGEPKCVREPGRLAPARVGPWPEFTLKKIGNRPRTVRDRTIFGPWRREATGVALRPS